MKDDRKIVYEKAKAATVAICLQFPDGRLLPFGSGVNVDQRGIIVTCKHVIEDAQIKRDSEGNAPKFPRSEQGVQSSVMPMYDIVTVFSHFNNDKIELGIARFEVLHGPHDSDLAVGLLRPDTPLPAAQIDDSDAVYEGQFAFTCGFPLGPDLQPNAPIGALFHRGIISGIRPHYLVQPRLQFLLDMSINPGNSGGPLFSEDSGKIIGIINARIQDNGIPTGIGCAIPANLVLPLVDRVSSLTDQQIEDMNKGIWPAPERSDLTASNNGINADKKC
jgi:S1-C subfamily serine protease